jgi:hypothetical protein
VKEADCLDKIVICDEFDEMIDRNTVVFFNNPFVKKVEVCGMLATTKAKKLFLLSATIDKYHSVFCMKVLKLKPAQMIEFLGARELFQLSAVNQV